ncbi:MAG: hypothetical protein KDA22_12885 [Phycisphaerales bacterium]|nr:hypothetical protein [Phycisphaerales bacterium]
MHSIPILSRTLVVVSLSLSLVGLAAADRPKPGIAAPAQGGIAGGSACGCSADIDNSGAVDGADLGLLLAQWGTSGSSDVDGSGLVDGADLGLLLAAWGPCLGAPSNDHCGNAIPVVIGQTIPFCTSGADTDGPSVAGSCGTFATQVHHDVWFEYVAQGDGALTASTCGTADFDTVIAVYSAEPGEDACPAPNGAGTLVTCLDDTALCTGQTTSLTFDVEAGRTYLIRVGGFGGASGTGELSFDFDSVGAQCFDGIFVSLADGETVTISGTTADNLTFGVPCASTYSGGEWITVELPCQTTQLTVSTCNPGTNFDTVVAAWKETISQGCDGELMDCVDDTIATSCLLGGNARKSKFSFLGDNTHLYHILVTGFADANGQYELTLKAECQAP